MTATENRLSHETSPYLRQHRFDPVDWYPWGEEAVARARELDRPLFLSIGYSSCHWCHVMAHESFSDPLTALEMNEAVVAVKVDREERPEVDAVYMEAVVAASGNGGWPMSIFATPEGKPFFVGTYFPRQPHHNLPSFRQVLAAVSDVWKTRREDVEGQAERLSDVVVERLSSLTDRSGTRASLDRGEILAAIRTGCTRLVQIADREHGGFGDAPKFPQPLLLDMLLRAEADGTIAGGDGAGGDGTAVMDTLEAMACGGIHDQIGGGFSRYSVDRFWTVPHFEKMLYDQALLARVYLHAWQLTGEDRWKAVTEEIFEYVLSRLSHPSGGFCAAEDADSEGEEGRYYVWPYEEFVEAVGPEHAPQVAQWYGVTPTGNFEGRNVLTAPRPGYPRPEAVQRARRLLAARREERVHPSLDDKVLTEWNAMTCSVLAEAAAAMDSSRYGEAAHRVFSVLFEARRRNGGATPRTVSPGGRPLPGCATDVAWLLEASIRLYELTGQGSYLTNAREIADELLGGYVDDETGAVLTSSKTEARVGLFTRAIEGSDGVTPSAASVAARALGRLGWLLGEGELTRTAERIVLAFGRLLSEAPTACPELLWAADLLSAGPIEIAARSVPPDLIRGLQRRFLPPALYAWAQEGATDIPDLPLLAGRREGHVYVCTAGVCRMPTDRPDAANSELDKALSARAALGSDPYSSS